MSSPNGIDWETLAEIELQDLAIDPTSLLHLLGTTYIDELHESVDGGVTWSLVEEAPPVTLLQWTGATIVGIRPDGTLLSAPSPAGPWTTRSAVGGEPEALLVGENSVRGALEGGLVLIAPDTDGPSQRCIPRPLPTTDPSTLESDQKLQMWPTNSAR